MVQEALEGLAELVVRGVRASADPGEAAGKAGAGLRALGVWVERLAGEGSVAEPVRREPMPLRAEVPVESGRMSLGIPSAVGVLDPGDFPEAFVVVRETEEEAVLGEGDSFLMVDGPWGPVVVPEEVAVRVEVAGEGAVMEVPEAAEKLEMAEEPVVACEVKVDVVAPVEAAVVEAVTVPEEVPVVSVPLVAEGTEETEVETEVSVPEEVPVVGAKKPEVVVVPLREEPVVKKTHEVEAALEMEMEVKVSVPEEEPVVEEEKPEVVLPVVGLETEAKGPEEAGREVVGWRMPEPVAVAPAGRGPGVVMKLMLLVLLVLVGWLAYKVVMPRGY